MVFVANPLFLGILQVISELNPEKLNQGRCKEWCANDLQSAFNISSKEFMLQLYHFVLQISICFFYFQVHH